MSVCSQVPITNFFKRSSNVIEKQNCSSEHKSCEASTVNTNPSFDNAEFPFPFTPYKIQVDFMKELYHTLQEGKIGIFESPTGTGKSLSLICGALTWLRDHEARKRSDLEASIATAEKASAERDKIEDADWFQLFVDKKEDADKVIALKQEYRKYELLDQLIKDLKVKKEKAEIVTKQNGVEDLLKDVKAVQEAIEIEFNCNDQNDEDFILDDYVSDEEQSDEEHELNVETDVKDNITKIYYCSRTHSQLSQFVNEVKKSPFKNEIRLVPLSSRQNLCINESVLRLKSLTSMNNRCLELQKNKGKKAKVSVAGEVLKKRKHAGRCPYYKQHGIESLKDIILTNIKDIEELANIGRKSETCPYYASRHAVSLTQLVVLPYNILLHKPTREACGIDLVNNVIIIDEAHNLLDAICNIHSSHITGSQLIGALAQLSHYKDRYSSRLKALNLLYINQLIFIIRAFIKYLKENCRNDDDKKIITLNDFVINTKIDNLNMFKVLRYCKKSELSRKLLGFSEKYKPQVKKLEGNQKSSMNSFLEELSEMKSTEAPKQLCEKENFIASSPLMQIESFFQCLTNNDKNGRIVLSSQSSIEDCSLKYYLLNPASHFQDIISNAKAVIVAGGTLQPISEFSDQLFQAAGASLERIVHFSCGHVIPSNHLSVLALVTGPTGVELDFSYNNRSSESLIDELGRIIMNLCNIVPGGMVCFFPSYDYENKVVSIWKACNILEKMNAKKKVFREPRNSNQINQILSEFSKCILENKRTSVTNLKTKGAILFSIVGGKMSEGINFSDDLGRCIIVIGMPFANIHSAELQEKITYLNATLPKSLDGKTPGQAYYESLCMKAVNQSIGRAIRHRHDFASILLLDRRYSRPSVQKALPGWICKEIKTCEKFGEAYGSVREKQTLPFKRPPMKLKTLNHKLIKNMYF